MSYRIVRLAHGHRAVEEIVDLGQYGIRRSLLKVPPFPTGTPRPNRIRAMEYVIRRQYGLAEMVVNGELDEVGAVGRRANAAAEIARLAALRPHDHGLDTIEVVDDITDDEVMAA